MGLEAPVDPLTDGSSDELEGTQPLIPSEDGEWTEEGEEEKKGDPLQRLEKRRLVESQKQCVDGSDEQPRAKSPSGD